MVSVVVVVTVSMISYARTFDFIARRATGPSSSTTSIRTPSCSKASSGGRGPGRVDAFVELEPEKAGTDRASQAARFGDLGERAAGEQALHHGFDLGVPGAHRVCGCLGEGRVLLRARHQLGHHRHVAARALALVQLPTDAQQRDERGGLGELRAVVLDAAVDRVAHGRIDQTGDGAEVVEHERLVHPGAPGDGASRQAGDAVEAQRVGGRGQQPGAGIGHGCEKNPQAAPMSAPTSAAANAYTIAKAARIIPGARTTPNPIAAARCRPLAPAAHGPLPRC